MAYAIEYFREGNKIGDSPHQGPLGKTEEVAKNGLLIHNADFARIIDDNSGAEVSSVRRGAEALRS